MQSHPSRGQRLLLLLLGLVCVALVAGAVALQVYAQEYPCPLCIIMRYLFLLIALVALIGSACAGRVPRLVAAWLALLLAVAGAAVGGRLAYVQAHPSASCGIDVMQTWTDAIPLAQWWPTVFQATGMCGDTYPPILGLSLPQWGMVGFAAIALALLAGLVKAHRARG